MRRTLRVCAALAGIALVAAACAAPRQTVATSTPGGTAAATPNFEGKTLNVVTGPAGGVYIVYGAGLADVLSKRMKVAASAQQTTASVDNMKFIGQGKADLAFTLADTAYDGISGKAPQFTEKVDAKALAVLYTNYTQIVAKDGTGINTVADLKGRRVSVGLAGSGTEIITNRILDVYGMDPNKDIQRERLGPAGTYKNDTEIVVSGVQNLLVVNSKFDPAFAKAILTTIFDFKSDLETIHAEAKNLKLETATVGSPLEFHPGAIDFYKSRGAWKP